MIKFVDVKQNLSFSFLLLLTLAANVPLSAQVSFSAKLSQKVVGQGDMLEISFSIDGVSEVDNFTPPSFGPFQVVQGPSYTSGFNLINGNASKYYSVSYYLKPTALGKFTIGSASVMMGNQSVRSNTVNVEVVKGSTGGGAAPPANPFQSMLGPSNMDPLAPTGPPAYGDQYLRKGEKVDDKIRHNMMLKMSVNKNSCYVGEPIVATCKLYSRLESESRVVERPSFSGFSVFEMAQPEQGTVSREVIGGRPFNGYLIRKAQLYPLQSGSLSIEPVELDNSITFYREGKSGRTQAPAGSVFDQMMRDFWGDGEGEGVPEKHQLSLTTDSVTIHVKPLPETGKPADFSGAVGQFNLQASLTGTTLKTNETDTLVLALAGSGNLPLINAPALKLPSGLEVYDPSAKEQLDVTTSPIKGRKLFTYVFTAGQEGNYTLPSVSFSYFDPQTATYKSVQTEPLLLKVMPGSGKRSDRGVQTAPVGWPSSRWVWVVAGLLSLGVLALGFWKLRRGRKPEETSIAVDKAPLPLMPQTHAAYRPQWDARVQQMAPVAVTTFEEKDWLEEARERLKEGNSGSYYRALNAGLWGFLQESLKLGGERNTAHVLTLMGNKGFSPFVMEETRQLLEECELALYAPIQSSSDMQRAMALAERLQKRFVYNLKD